MPGNLCAALWVGTALMCVVGCGDAGSRPPSLLVLTLESLRADALGCYGGEPTRGARLCGADAPGRRYGWTFAPAPTAAPSAASLWTGVYPPRHGLDERPGAFLSSAPETAAERLAAAGWRTAAFVGSPELNRSRNLDQGFALYDDRLEHRPERPPRRNAEAQNRSALDWIGEGTGQWLVWIHYGDLHSPLEGPPIRNYESYRQRYRGAIDALDARVGALLDALDERGEVFGLVVAGLHGESMGEDGHWFEHGHSLGLEQVRVPLRFRPAGAEGSSFVGSPVSLVDVTPTLLAAAGLEPDVDLDGRALPDASDPPTDRAVLAVGAGERAIAYGGHYYARGDDPRRARIARLEPEGSLPGSVSPPPAAWSARIERLEELLGALDPQPDALPPAPEASDAPEPPAAPASPAPLAPEAGAPSEG